MVDDAIMKQICSICGTTAATSEFYAGVNTRCKECHKAKVRDNRAAKRDYYRKYDANRFRNDPRVKDRHRRYNSTEGGKASLDRARAKWREANAEKRAAHVILGNAVKYGKIVKPNTCSACGAGGVIDGHHTDYSLPLVVKWLCRKCHAAEHR